MEQQRVATGEVWDRRHIAWLPVEADQRRELGPNIVEYSRRYATVQGNDGPRHGVDTADMAGENFAAHRQSWWQHDTVPNGRTREVIGQTMAKRLACQNASGATTSAGRRPPCSRPIRGSKSVQMRSPSFGSKSASLNDFSPEIRAPVECGTHLLRSYSDQQVLQAIPRLP